MTSLYDYVFPENGLVAYKNGELIATQVISLLSLFSFVCNLCLVDLKSPFLPQLQSNPSATATLVTEKIKSNVDVVEKQCQARGWGGGGGRAWVGILTFSKKIIKIPTPRQKIMFKSMVFFSSSLCN